MVKASHLKYPVHVHSVKEKDINEPRETKMWSCGFCFGLKGTVLD